MLDSGAIRLEVSIPSIGATFSNRNFYSRQEGQIDLHDVERLAEEGRRVQERIRQMAERVSDERLNLAMEKAALAAELDSRKESELEDVQKADNELLEARKLMNQARQDNLASIRQAELDACVNTFRGVGEQTASEVDKQTFQTLLASAQRAIERSDNEFEMILEKMNGYNARAIFGQDTFLPIIYQKFVSNPADYMDQVRFSQLKRVGDQALAKGDMFAVRQVIAGLIEIRISKEGEDDLAANIIKG